MKTIIAPTDFSEVSLNAVNYAADLACVIGANLSLIHICPIPLVLSEVPAPPYSIAELEEDAGLQIIQLKEKISQRTGERIAINTMVKRGEVVKTIDEYCSSVDPYAIVMGAESTKVLERFLLGTKTIDALEHLCWPLIVVPSEAKFLGIRKIGLACDLKKVTDTLPVKLIKALVKEFGAELHVLYVNAEDRRAYSPATVEESMWLHEIVGCLFPQYHFIRDNDAEIAINEFAEKNGLDLLIVIPKKHGIAGKLFHHSFSKSLVLHTHLPVLAVHE
jgi:nucleotide-binding universal stress UspA family protein